MTRRLYVDGVSGDLAVQHRRCVGAENAPQMNHGSVTGTFMLYLNIQNVVPPGQLLKISFFFQHRIALSLFPQHQRI